MKIKKSQKVPAVITDATLAEKKIQEFCFSLKYLTTNSNYNFSYFKNAYKEKLNAQTAFIEKMQILSEHPWHYWGQLGKKQGGYETLPFKNIKFSPKINSPSLSQKVIVFRFFQDDYRVIGMKEDETPIFYVIGFDFNHSAYDHGS